MERKQFTWYRSYYDALKELPAEEFRDIVLAVCAYALDGEEPELSGVARAIFTLIRPTLEVGRSKAENPQPGGTNVTLRRTNRQQAGTNEKQTGTNAEQTGTNRQQTGTNPQQTGTNPQGEREGERERERE